jgi:hypothetical protein
MRSFKFIRYHRNKMAASHQRVTQGGLFSTRRPNISRETQDLLKGKMPRDVHPLFHSSSNDGRIKTHQLPAETTDQSN